MTLRTDRILKERGITWLNGGQNIAANDSLKNLKEEKKKEEAEEEEGLG